MKSLDECYQAFWRFTTHSMRSQPEGNGEQSIPAIRWPCGLLSQPAARHKINPRSWTVSWILLETDPARRDITMSDIVGPQRGLGV